MEKILNWKKYNESIADDVSNLFGGLSNGPKIGKLGKLIQLIIQGRENELHSWGNSKTIEEVKKYVNQIPKNKLDILKNKSGQEIQQIFQNSLHDLYNYLDKKGVL